MAAVSAPSLALLILALVVWASIAAHPLETGRSRDCGFADYGGKERESGSRL